MSVLFAEYPKCTTCQKAKKWLDAAGVSYEDRHIKEQNPSAEELKKWHQMSGLPLKKFFNTSGLLYKSMGWTAVENYPDLQIYMAENLYDRIDRYRDQLRFLLVTKASLSSQDTCRFCLAD